MSTPDPFGTPDKVPSLSFRDVPVGTSYTGRVVAAPELVQSRDFDSKQPLYWDPINRGKKTTVPNGDPVMSAVVHIEINGDVWAIWAQRPSSMFAAIRDAAGGAPLAAGGTLTVTYTGEKSNPDKPHLNAAKQYAATYIPPAGQSAFAETPPPASPMPPAAAPIPTPPPAPPVGSATAITAPPIASFPAPPTVAPAPVTTANVAAVTGPATTGQTVTPEQYAALQNLGIDMTPYTLAAV